MNAMSSSEETLKRRVGRVIQGLLDSGPFTQRDLATRLGIKQATLWQYLNGEALPGLEVLIKIADLVGKSLDWLVREETPLSPKEKEQVHIQATSVAFGNRSIAAGRDVYFNTKVHRTHKYEPKSGDITPEQASRFKNLVEGIVELEKTTRPNPKGFAGVWNALNRHCRVTYYREIKQEQFAEAELYLTRWTGRLKKGLKRVDKDRWRTERYSGVFGKAGELGLSKDQIDELLWARYNKGSLSDLTQRELEGFYRYIFGLGRKR